MSEPITHMIGRAQQGDRFAREELTGLLRERVSRTARHYAGITGMDRDDLQQEMWVGVLLGLEQVDPSIGDPLCYLYLRAKWRLLEAIRSSRREQSWSLDSTSADPEVASFEEEVLTGWEVRRMSAQLPPRQQAIFRGLLLGHLQEDLARSLGCTAANVSYHVRKIRERYRRLNGEN
jgi:RNA polymerase sigma factor (sigma-70 family)